MADSRSRPGRTPSKRSSAGRAEAPLAAPLSSPPVRSSRSAESPLLGRLGLAAQLGLGTGFLDLDTRLGYPPQVLPEQIARLYRRGDIAYAIVTAFPNETWGAGEIWIAEDPDPEILTPFEESFGAFAARLDLWQVFRRADIYGCVTEYGAIMIGAPGDVDTPLPNGTSEADIAYLTAYPSTSAKISQVVTDVNSPDFGKPEYYSISTTGLLRSTSGNSSAAQRIISKVHASRILHVVYDPDIDPWRAVPMLERVWDRIIDLKKLLGGGSQSFYDRGKTGLIAEIDPDSDPTPTELAAFDDAAAEFQAGVSQMLRAQGVSVKTLQTKADSFSSSVDTVLKFIGSPFRIPTRKLLGSEQGVLAGSQDERDWNGTIATRRNTHCAARVADLINRLSPLGYLPIPNISPVVIWPARETETLASKATITSALASANASQVTATGSAIFSPNEIRMDIWAKEAIIGGDITQGVPKPVNPNPFDPSAIPFGSAQAVARKCIALGARPNGIQSVGDFYSGLMRSQVSRMNVKVNKNPSTRSGNKKNFSTLCAELFPGTVQFAESMFADMRAATIPGLENHLMNSQSESIDAIQKSLLRTHDTRMGAARSHITSIMAAGGNFAKRHSIIKRRSSASARSNAAISLAFDVNSQNVIDYAAKWSSSLVTEVEQSVIEAIRQMISNGVEKGIAPRKLARDIEQVVGLRSDQVSALENFIERLSSAEPGSVVYAGERKIRVPESLTPEYIQAQSDKYAAKLLRDRAVLIGRTEVGRSANAGLRESWSQSAAEGLIVNALREWSGALDDRERDEHVDMEGQTTTIDGVFDPPIEPGEEVSCRCNQALIID